MSCGKPHELFYKHELSYGHELTALPSLWKYYNNAKQGFAIHENLRFSNHERKAFKSWQAQLVNSSR